MTRKILSCIVALALLLSTAAGLAEALPQQENVTFSITAGAGIKMMAAPIADLLDAISLQFQGIEGKDVGGFSLRLNKEDVLAISLRTLEDGLLISSKALYEKPVFFSTDDMMALVEEAMKAAESDPAMAASVAQMQQVMATGELPQAEAVDAIALKGQDVDLSDPETRQAMIDATGGDDTFVKWMENVMSRMVETEGEFTGETHDTADKKTEVSLTEEDMASLFETTYVKQVMAQQLAASGLDEKELDATLAELAAEYRKMDVVMDMVILEKGEDIVSIYMPATITMPVEVVEAMETEEATDATDATEAAPAEPQVMTMELKYDRLTTDGNAAYTFGLTMNVEGEGVAINGRVQQKAAEAYDMLFSVDVTGMGQVLLVQGTYEKTEDKLYALLSVLPLNSNEVLAELTYEKKAEAGFEGHLSIYLGGSTAELLELTSDKVLILTLNLVSEKVQADGRFDDILALTAADAVQPTKLTPEESSAFQNELLTNLQKLAEEVLPLLPQSFLAFIGAA